MKDLLAPVPAMPKSPQDQPNPMITAPEMLPPAHEDLIAEEDHSPADHTVVSASLSNGQPEPEGKQSPSQPTLLDNGVFSPVVAGLANAVCGDLLNNPPTGDLLFNSPPVDQNHLPVEQSHLGGRKLSKEEVAILSSTDQLCSPIIGGLVQSINEGVVNGQPPPFVGAESFVPFAVGEEKRQSPPLNLTEQRDSSIIEEESRQVVIWVIITASWTAVEIDRMIGGIGGRKFIKVVMMPYNKLGKNASTLTEIG